MSEDFNNKDYWDYINRIENRILNKESNNPAPIAEKRSNASKQHRALLLRRRRVLVLSAAAILLIAVILITLIVKSVWHLTDKDPTDATANTNLSDVSKDEKENIFYPFKTADTEEISEAFKSNHIIVMRKDGSIKAMRDPFARAYPASTTKVMTLLTAIDYITDFEDTFTMTYQITDPLYAAGATVAGFSAGEAIRIYDMLYGIILPSGGDASIGIAEKVAGSEEEFVKLMNKKAEELGLKDTHFTNCTGLFDSDHYTTAADMAVILHEAIKNPLCRKILSTYQYTAKPTAQHPEGLLFSSSLFSYMYGTEPQGATILGGKTGFVSESGYCIASFGENDEGEEFIVVTLKAPAKWPAVYDQIDLYTAYVSNNADN